MGKDKHNQNIDKVRGLYNQMINWGLGKRQKNNWIKLFEPQLEKWWDRNVIKLIEPTPPTEEEVCKALGQYYWGYVVYRKEEKEFWLTNIEDDKDKEKLLVYYDNGEIHYNEMFTAKENIMIGRFYEAQNERQN